MSEPKRSGRHSAIWKLSAGTTVPYALWRMCSSPTSRCHDKSKQMKHQPCKFGRPLTKLKVRSNFGYDVRIDYILRLSPISMDPNQWVIPCIASQYMQCMCVCVCVLEGGGKTDSRAKLSIHQFVVASTSFQK